MARAYLIWPDPRLKRVAEPVAAVDNDLRALWDEMLDAMYAMPGVGLAAPQLGVARRLIVVDAGTERQPLRMANPQVLHASVKLRAHEEASPNFPGFSAVVERPRAVTVRYLDEAGAEVETDLVGLWATSVQHQIDHLDGWLYFDRLKPVKRRMLLDKYAKRQRREGR